MRPLRSVVPTLCLAALLASVAGCGGGGSAESSPAGGTPTVADRPATVDDLIASGVVSRGGLAVGSGRFDTGAARVIDDRGRGAAQLADGMQVKLRGRVAADGVSGSADLVATRPRLRGSVTSVDAAAVPPSFVANGVRVFIGEGTVMANGATLGTLLGQRVEVHGQLDFLGRLRATRVETGLAADVPDLLKGRAAFAVVSDFYSPLARDPRGEQLDAAEEGGTAGDRQRVNTFVTPSATAVYVPSASDCRIDAFRWVEVHGRRVGPQQFIADRIVCEALVERTVGLQPVNGARGSVEGLVHPNGDEAVDAAPIGLRDFTVYLGGAAADFDYGASVRIDGQFEDGRLLARNIVFQSPRASLQGTITSIAGRTLTVLGRTVRFDDLTWVVAETARPATGLPGSSVPAGSATPSVPWNLAVGAHVTVVGTAAGGATLVAEMIRKDLSATDDVVQGVVTAKTASSITLLGEIVSLPVTPPPDGYTDSTGRTYPTLQAFLDAIGSPTSGATVVKVTSRLGAVAGARILR